MYGFRLAGGDIAVRGDGNVSVVTGAERIKQELACWLLEPLGTDVLYPGFGSTLRDIIGSPMLEEYMSRVRSEVARVVGNYIEYQKNQINESIMASEVDFLTNWQEDDVITDVGGIRMSMMADELHVRVELRLAGGENVVVEYSI